MYPMMREEKITIVCVEHITARLRSVNWTWELCRLEKLSDNERSHISAFAFRCRNEKLFE